MTDVACPLDGRPCARDCPDRFEDAPRGGCILTLALELGSPVLHLEGSRLRRLTSDGPGDALPLV